MQDFIYIIILHYDYVSEHERKRKRERIRSKKRLIVLNNSRFEEATLTHLADHMVKRRNLAVYSHISKEKISINNNKRKQSPNQCCCCPPSPTHLLFLCHLLYYILCISNIPYEAQESKFICFWMWGIYRGEIISFLSAEVVDSVLTPLHHACLPPPDIHAHKRQIIRKGMSGDKHDNGCHTHHDRTFAQQTQPLWTSTAQSQLFSHSRFCERFQLAVCLQPLLFLLLTNVLSALQLLSSLCTPLTFFLIKGVCSLGTVLFQGLSTFPKREICAKVW